MKDKPIEHKVWRKSETNPNWTFEEKETHYISYNPSPVWADEGGDETALCFDDKYYILNGNWCEEYEKIIESKEECLKLYNKLAPKYISQWSDDYFDRKENI